MEMENNVMETVLYVDYNDRVQIDLDAFMVTLWNKYIEYKGRGENKIFLNDKGFFEGVFKNSYDAACAVAIGDWRYTDEYVFFNSDGYITSFCHWDDDNSPIDINKIDVHNLFRGLQDLQNLQNKNSVISRAIHDALQEI